MMTNKLYSIVAAAAFLAACPLEAQADVPDFIRSHEVATPQAAATPRSRSTASAPREVSIDALGRSFEFVLEVDPILAPNARVLWVGHNGIVEDSTNLPTFYSGQLLGDPDATVRLEFIDGALNGIVLSEGEKYYFEPATRYDKSAANDATLVYRASDTVARKEALGCGVEGEHDLGNAVQRATPRFGLGGGGTGLLEMGLVGDYELYQKHGAGTANHLLSLLSLVDAIYMDELDVTLQVTELVVYTTSGDPFSSTTDAMQLLYEFRDYGAAPASPVGTTGLAHLLSGRDYNGSTIGIAYVDTLCDGTFGVGVSQDFSSDNFSMSVLLSHEIGHNFGARHDGSSPCGSTGYGFIMWPALGGGVTDDFSTCSKDVMSPSISSASCIAAAIPEDCGDGILDPGEECDDANNTSGDCCRLDCRLELYGSICASDSNECTDDICDGAGTCEHFNNTLACDDGNVCTTAGQCSAGSCQASTDPMLLSRVKLKAKFKSGDDNDSLKFKANVPTDGWISQPTAAGASFEILTAGGDSLYDSSIPAHFWSMQGNSGLSFRFAADGFPLPGTAGMDKVGVKYKLKNGYLQVKGKTKGTDLPNLVDQGSIRLRIQIGDDSLGDCGEVPTMGCSVKPGAQISCESQ